MYTESKTTNHHPSKEEHPRSPKMSCCPCLLLNVIFYASSALLLVVGVLRLLSRRYPKIERLEGERTYYSHVNKEQKEFPDLIRSPSEVESKSPENDASVYLSVIVPAYNEEHRLPKMLDEAIEYLEAQKYKYELIVVDDGSKYGTSSVVNEFSKKLGGDKIKLLKLAKNRGKGGGLILSEQVR